MLISNGHLQYEFFLLIVGFNHQDKDQGNVTNYPVDPFVFCFVCNFRSKSFFLTHFREKKFNSSVHAYCIQ